MVNTLFFKKTFSEAMWVWTGITACMLACIGDFASVYILAPYFPGYNHMKMPMSALGSSASPVGKLMSLCWIVVGILFVLFGISYRNATRNPPATVKLASLLIMIYGIGEGIGSGVFPGNHVAGHLTTTGIFHNIAGAIGVTGLLVLPFVLMKAFPKKHFPRFYHFSILTIILGIAFFILFTLSKVLPQDTVSLFLSRGFWQRLFVGVYYIYLIVIAIRMARGIRSLS